MQNALNVIAQIKSEKDALAVGAILEKSQDSINNALTTIGTVHFARFVFLNKYTQFAVMTEYDGDFNTYILDFVKHLGDFFNAVLPHFVDPPPLPVQQYPQEFVKWVSDAGVPLAGGLYSAYPSMTVLDILRCGGSAK